MTISERRVRDVTVLDIKGKMTLGEGGELLRERVTWLIRQGRYHVLLNMESMPYMDSAGLGAVIRCKYELERRLGSLKLLYVTKRAMDLLLITSLHQDIEIYDEEATAIASFSTQSTTAP
jgi:anti-sigma B factor antagonist